MDSRSTFNNLAGLRSILETLHVNKEEASLLVDKNGLTRMKGIIARIAPAPGSADEETVFYLDNGDSFTLRQVIAVNGEFRSEYSEC